MIAQQWQMAHIHETMKTFTQGTLLAKIMQFYNRCVLNQLWLSKYFYYFKILYSFQNYMEAEQLILQLLPKLNYYIVKEEINKLYFFSNH